MRDFCKRRSGIVGPIALVAALGVGLAACGSSSTSSGQSGQTKLVKVTAQIYPQIPSSWLTQVADTQGFFKKNGINIKLLSVNTGPQATAALASGSANTILTAPDALGVLIEKGQDLSAITAGGYPNLYDLMVSNKLNTPTGFPAAIKALKGKKIGVTALGSGAQFMLEALVQAAGMPVDSVTYVPTGAVTTALASLKSGQIDGLMAYPPGIILAKSQGIGRSVLDLRKPNPDFNAYPTLKNIVGAPYFVVGVKTSWVNSNPSTVKAYQLSMNQADCWIHDPNNLSAFKALVKNQLGAPEGISQSQFDTYISEGISITHAYMPKQAAQAWSDFGLKYKETDTVIPINKWYVPSMAGTAAAVIQSVKSAGGSCPGGA